MAREMTQGKKIVQDSRESIAIIGTADNLWRLDVVPKNIYVAASLANQYAACRLSLQLIDAGFCATSRWVRRDFSRKPCNWTAFVALEEEMGKVNVEDLERADTLVLLSDVESTSGGFHVELGFFLGAKRTNIVVVGERKNVFFYTEHVRFAATVEGLVEWLSSPEHGRQATSSGVGASVPRPLFEFSNDATVTFTKEETLRGRQIFSAPCSSKDDAVAKVPAEAPQESTRREALKPEDEFGSSLSNEAPF
jgi:hypothetical protein